MRNALYSELNKINSSVKVYHISHPLKKKEPPFVILKMETEVQTRLSSFTPFSVFCYSKAGDLNTLDNLCGKIKNALNKKMINRVSDDTSFIIEYEGASADFVDDDFNAVCRKLSFKVPIFGNDFL
ncbi:MAG: hypothetical protein CR988_02390 [Treponema sp.]|nr:MAG: hypothetical protein CR988_02390 [Treponema sp.]